MLNRVFPECEVHIVMSEEIFESQDLSDWSQNEFREEEHG